MIKLNLSVLVKKHSFLFAVLMIAQIISIVMLLFSFGVYQTNLYNLYKASPTQGNLIDITIRQDFASEAVKKIKQEFPEAISRFDASLECIILSGSLDKKRLAEDNRADEIKDIRASKIRVYASDYVENGKFIVNEEEIVYNENQQWFSEEGLEKGEKGCFLGKSLKQLENNGKIIINGTEYNVVDHFANEMKDEMIQFPSKAFPEEIEELHIEFVYKHALLKSQYDREMKILEDMFEADWVRNKDEDVLMHVEIKATWKSMMFVSAIMGIVASSVICLIYRFIQKEREKNTAIYEMCGCERMQAVKIYMGEILVLLLVSIAAALLIFNKLVVPVAMKRYYWFAEILNWKITINLLIAFAVSVIVLTALMMMIVTRKPPKEILRRREF